MAYAEASDVIVRWGKAEVEPEIEALIEVRLDDVERLISKRISDLSTQASDPTFLADLIQVESDAVLRLARNPEGYLSETDGNYTYMLRQELSTGELEILPREWNTLGVTKSGMFFITPNPVMPT